MNGVVIENELNVKSEECIFEIFGEIKSAKNEGHANFSSLIINVKSFGNSYFIF